MKDTFSYRLKLIRKKKGLTQEELAKKANISTVSVSNYERGIRTPDEYTFNQLSMALSFPSDILKNGIEENLQKFYNYEFFINADSEDLQSYYAETQNDYEAEMYVEAQKETDFINDFVSSLVDLRMFDELDSIANYLSSEKINIVNAERLRRLKNETTDLSLLKYDPFDELEKKKKQLKDFHVYFGNDTSSSLKKLIDSDKEISKKDLQNILDKIENK
jgi:transcriptional regulator with XRE-family HTH domain